MSTANQMPGDRACRYAREAETVLRAYALRQEGDLAWGLVRLVEDAADGLEQTVGGDDTDAFDAVSCRYAQVKAIISAALNDADDDLVYASESLVEMAKEMIDAEHNRRRSPKKARS
ncbi:MAG: hypothetical protein ACRYGA_00610 [Janthinobacterium lividum]